MIFCVYIHHGNSRVCLILPILDLFSFSIYLALAFCTGIKYCRSIFIVKFKAVLLTIPYITNIIQWSCCQNFVVPSLAFDCSGNLSVSCVTSHPIPLQCCGFGLVSSLWTPLCSEFPGDANALCWLTCCLW